MTPISDKRIQLYLKYRRGFVVFGTGPKGFWVVAGGRLRQNLPETVTKS